MMPSFDQVIERRGTACFKYDALKLFYGRDDLLALWVADMDFAVSPQIQQALANRMQHPVYGYNFKAPAFQEALGNWLFKRHGWDTSAHALTAFPSLMTALAISILSLTQKKDKILIQTPVYPPFSMSVLEHQRELLCNSLINDNGVYSIDWSDFEAKAVQCKMFILCNPHNPVGRVFTREELQRMADICKKHKVIIFSDEIHSDLIYPGQKHIPIASLAEDICLTGISPAKSFNLAGMGTAVLICKNRDLLDTVQKLNQALHTYMGNSFGLVAFTAAYGESEAWLEELLGYLHANAQLIKNEIPRILPRVTISPIEGTYLAWLDFRAYGLSELDLMNILKDRCHLALNAGSSFGKEGEGFMRLNFGCSRVILEEALQNLKLFGDGNNA
ncbi:MAG: PatB family C-S lyase [Candidatus Cloacimonadaceae bacterium]|nr:PatB family C-S lyase [Candidatus Cloacimonadota bacterium]